MVVVKLMGGLGNQMFQYALARKLSLLYEVPLKLDISHYETYESRKYSLNVLNIIEDLATKDDIMAIKGKRLAKVKYLTEKILPYYKRSCVSERFLSFDDNIFRTPKNVHLTGYWQSESYFKDIEEVICREFAVKVKQSDHSEKIAALIDSCNAVSLHVRRTDYVSVPDTNQSHGICSLDYYQQAVGMISEKVASPHFFVFSDDILWAKENLKIGHPTTFVSGNNKDRDFEDMRLISRCGHHIIANSSFSWWGAWLSRNVNKIIICPKKWFNNPRYFTETRIPAGWCKI